MLRLSQKIFSKFSNDNSRTIKEDEYSNIPEDYVIAKFYEFGYKVSHNKDADVYNSSCPICREGKSWGRKKRSFYLPKENLIYCHNCGWSSRPYRWIREVSGLSDEQLKSEISEGNYGVLDVLNLDDQCKEIKKLPSLPEDSINLFDDIQINYYKDNKIVQRVVEYLRSRKLDTAKNRPDALYLSLKDSIHKNRLVIPFKDQNGKIVFYQSRKVFDWDSKDSYISKYGSDKSIYGLDKISMDFDTVFKFEGPIDSFFIRNGIAVGGINKGKTNFTPLQTEQMESLKFLDQIWVLDSQWLDQTSREKTESLIEQNEKVFIWPENWGKRYKDFNAMCMALNLDEISPKFVKENTFKGINAEVRLKLLKSRI